MKNCPNCGHPNAPDAAFCAECGRALPTGRPCPGCGFTGNPPQAAYCVQCGASLRRRSFVPFIWMGGLALILVVAVILWQTGLLQEWATDRAMPSADHVPTLTATSSAVPGLAATAEKPAAETASPSSDTPTPSSTRAQSSTATPPSTATRPPTATPPSSTAPAIPQPTLRWASIGQSVRGQDLSIAIIGDEMGSALVIVGSIQGDQINTRDMTKSLIDYFDQNPQLVPGGVVLYFIPSLNPDGNASNSRFNANGVDLNRNWDTSDWRSKAVVPGYPNGKSGAGGSSPFSEPETRALRDFLLTLRSQGRDIRVVVLHSSVRRTQGEVYPGGDDAIDVAHQYASVAGYDIERAWKEYTTSGEVVTWCAEQGITSIDVVFPGSQEPSSRISGAAGTLLDITVRALLGIAESPQ
jgi:predicted deacylase